MSPVGEAAVQCCDRCGFVLPTVVDPLAETASCPADPLDQTVANTFDELGSDRYRILRAVATGAQGRLLLAMDQHLDQLCVIKVLRQVDDAWLDIAVARLRNEARAGVCVNHPNIARVFDCDCAGGLWYFVMEYVEGQNLRSLVNSAGRILWAQAVEIGVQAAAGLTAIHDAGLIHRDMKPSNLMLRPDGMVKIMDLGLVKIRPSDPDLTITRTGQMVGTPYYMAPEQFEAAEDIRPQADVYSLGATLYHMVVGRPPFEGTGVLDVAQKHRREPVVWPADVVERVPAGFRRIIEICLAKRPEHRFASAAALGEALRAGDGAVEVAGPADERVPEGVAVMTFRNLSARPEDDWIGEAIAECLNGRLMELQGVHLGDRTSFGRMLARGTPTGSGGQESEQIIQAARMVGAGTVVAGGFQRVGANLRISAHLVSARSDAARHVATVSGGAEDLFALEDELGDRLIEMIGAALAPKRRRYTIGGTESLEALEKFIRGRRAFADADYQGAMALAREAMAADPAYLEPISLIGACHARLGEYDRAVDHHQRQERLAREMDDEPRLAEALSNLGVMYYYKGEYSLAYEFLERARQLSCGLSLHTETAKILGNLGFVLMRLNRPAEAEAAFAEAIEISKRCADLVALQWPYNGMGTVLLKLERYAEAREYYRRALALAEEIGDRVNMGVSRMNLGRCACLVGDFEAARAQFDSALAGLEGTGFWNGLTLVYEHMAEMHLQTGRPSDALECIDKRIDLACRHDNHRMEADGWEQKARACEQMGRTDEAIRALKKSVEVSQRPAPYESLHAYLEAVCRRPAFR